MLSSGHEHSFICSLSFNVITVLKKQKAEGMLVLNTAFVGRQLDVLNLPPCKKRYGKIRWPDMLGHRIFPCWCSSNFFIFSENLKFSYYSDFFEDFSENLKFSDFF